MSLEEKMTELTSNFQKIASDIENETGDRALQIESIVQFCELIKDIIAKRKHDLKENAPESDMLTLRIEHCDDTLEMVDDLLEEIKDDDPDNEDPDDDVFDYFDNLQLILNFLVATPPELPVSE